MTTPFDPLAALDAELEERGLAALRDRIAPLSFWDAGSMSFEVERGALSCGELGASEALLFSN